MNKSKKTKTGISLIVLVITIIVMIVLASAIILSLRSSGIIGRANEATFKSDVASIKEKLEVAKAKKLLDDETVTFTSEEKAEILGEYDGILQISDDGILSPGPNATNSQIEQLEDVGISSNIAKLSDWEYYLSGTDIILLKYIGTKTELVIPATYYLEENEYYAGNTAGTYNVKICTYGADPALNGAFYNNTNITSIEFEDGIMYYPDMYTFGNLFVGCTNLKTVYNIPSLYALEPTLNGFNGCTSLEFVSIGSNIYSVNSWPYVSVFNNTGYTRTITLSYINGVEFKRL